MIAAASGLAASIQVRLVRHAKAIGVDPNLILTRYAIERFLYRLSRSPYADRFVLKGALLMLVWLGETIRPTRDADLLGFGDLSAPVLASIFAEVRSVSVEPDGVTYLAPSIRVAPIREEDVYGGMRVTIGGLLGNARLRVQVDVGIGDAVTPEPQWLDYPALLDLPRPRLRAYRPETSIAEKLHAMVVLGEVNSRMRDFFDVYALSRHDSFDAELLVRAVRATFERRRTPVPSAVPIALTPEFGELRERQAQWTAFLRKSGLVSAPDDFGEVVRGLRIFPGPVVTAVRAGSQLKADWLPGGPWKQVS